MAFLASSIFLPSIDPLLSITQITSKLVLTPLLALKVIIAGIYASYLTLNIDLWAFI